ncbi:MAG: MFS transporter [Planctomycetales bacterium]|nr:MFS transporter [Planctomycetales bacterium]
MTEVSTVTKSPSSRRETTGLVLLFGAMYFVQGIAEPTEGLIAQPVRSLLKSWGYSAAGIAGFGALLALPWSLKPLYGLLTDFVPIDGTRRRSYLLLTSAASVLGLACLYFIPVPVGAYRQLLFLLLVPTVGVAFSDVVVDALMVEKGQPRGLTGLLQSVQWAAMYGGSILAGLVGGYLSQHGHQQEGFLMCAVTSFATLLLAWFYVKETPQAAKKGRLGLATKELAGAARKPAVLAAAAFLFLWSFNPFSMSVLYLHMTKQLAISEQFYGFTISLLSVGAIVGSLAYGTYCRRVPMSRLIHLAIAAGVLSTLAYCGVTGKTSAAIISVIVGFTYLTGSMVQFDLAARACPVAAAGTTFAMLMALSNLSLSMSTALGGWLYDDWSAKWGATTAFNSLVIAGALSTCACWLLVPLLNSAIKSDA